ncbi:MAG TPA: Calx-beta domain-containing protein [Pyrinomonadaceae bacterium]|nr:Calx-beta domain-containing protein [Pyrinomonadaceae bacterium]
MRYFPIPATRLEWTRLLGLICLMFVTSAITQAQSDPTIRINDLVMNEGDSNLFGYEFEVKLSAPSTKTVSVTVSTQSGTATSNIDFGAGTIVLDIPPGKTSQLLTVFIIGDTIVEPTEDFFLNLSNPVNATIADNQGVGTIVDDDTLSLVTQPGSQRAAAIDSVFLTHESFPIVNNMSTFAADNRMRISVLAVGAKLAPGEGAGAVTATAEDSVGTIRPLTVEFAGTIPSATWLTQVVLKLNDQIPNAGDIKIKITVHGATSNTVLVAVQPQ